MSGCTLTQFPRRFGVTAVAEETRKKVGEYVTIIGGICAILMLAGGIFIWQSGGLKPGTQVENEQLKYQFQQLRISFDTLSGQFNALGAKLENFPRTDDFRAWNDHAQRQDSRMDDLQKQISSAVQDISALQATVGKFDSTRVRDPRH